ncbi:MAG TPA: hypothetical protein VHV55_16630 [Pirellulales bacterium]|nr:hypothetical protein [Pirellulales bacterium]
MGESAGATFPIEGGVGDLVAFAARPIAGCKVAKWLSDQYDQGMIDADPEAVVELVVAIIDAVINELLKGDFDDVSGESQTVRSEAESQASAHEPREHPA